MNQLSFFNHQSTIIPSIKPRATDGNQQSSGAKLRDKGMARAAQHAEEISDGWGRKALDFLYIYAQSHERFSGEMVRLEAKGIVEDPPSLRAWGSVLVNGAKRGWIKQIDYIKVINPKAHRTPAALWQSTIFKR